MTNNRKQKFYGAQSAKDRIQRRKEYQRNTRQGILPLKNPEGQEIIRSDTTTHTFKKIIIKEMPKRVTPTRTSNVQIREQSNSGQRHEGPPKEVTPCTKKLSTNFDLEDKEDCFNLRDEKKQKFNIAILGKRKVLLSLDDDSEKSSNPYLHNSYHKVHDRKTFIQAEENPNIQSHYACRRGKKNRWKQGLSLDPNRTSKDMSHDTFGEDFVKAHSLESSSTFYDRQDLIPKEQTKTLHVRTDQHQTSDTPKPKIRCQTSPCHQRRSIESARCLPLLPMLDDGKHEQEISQKHSEKPQTTPLLPLQPRAKK